VWRGANRSNGRCWLEVRGASIKSTLPGGGYLTVTLISSFRGASIKSTAPTFGGGYLTVVSISAISGAF
ncbi:unnamed protein product, partial [Linum tenue]